MNFSVGITLLILTLTITFPPQNGLLSSLPHLFAWIFAVLAGHMADVFLSKNILSLLTIRKLFTSLGKELQEHSNTLGYLSSIFGEYRGCTWLCCLNHSTGLLLPAIFCLSLLYLSSSFHATMIFLTLANATGSFTMGGLLINVLDIAPRWGFKNLSFLYSSSQGCFKISAILELMISRTKVLKKHPCKSDI